jgi:hypothetical protein
MLKIRSIFGKYIGTFFFITLLSFALLTTTITAIVDSYGYNILTESLENAALSAVEYIKIEGGGYDDITEYLYNCINITRKKDIVADAWELYGIKAYTLGNKGIYFVMPDDRICYMDETGEVTTIATQPNVVNMEWDVVDKILMLKIYNGMTQIAAREHRDEGGYMYEAWYDVYQVNTETKIITIN